MAETRGIFAILVTDVDQYTRAISRDEEAVTRRIVEDLKLFAEIALKFGGRPVGDRGDGLKILFPSVANGLQAGVEMQERVHQRNGHLAQGEAYLVHRMGLHLGDIMVVDDALGQEKVTGMAVVIAARLQEQARPGQIMYSKEVHQAAHQVLRHTPHLVGPTSLKGVAVKVTAYATKLHAGETLSAPDEPVPTKVTLDPHMRRQVVAEVSAEVQKEIRRWFGRLVKRTLFGAAALGVLAFGLVELWRTKSVHSEAEEPARVTKGNRANPVRGNASAPVSRTSRATRSASNTPKTNSKVGTSVPDSVPSDSEDLDPGSAEEAVVAQVPDDLAAKAAEYARSLRFSAMAEHLRPYSSNNAQMKTQFESAARLSAFESWFRGCLMRSGDGVAVSGVGFTEKVFGLQNGRLVYEEAGGRGAIDLDNLDTEDLKAVASSLATRFGRPSRLDRWLEDLTDVRS